MTLVQVARVVALFFVVVALTATAAGAATPRARLSGDVVPIAYDLSLSLDVADLRQTGSETIEVEVRRPVDAIVLSARALDVHGVSIDGHAAQMTTAAAVEQLALRSAMPIEPGRHRIALDFSGEIGAAEPGGLFSSHGQTEPYLTTLFEPSTARTVFPCFDEPQFRARFTLHVRAPQDWTVISNMPLRAKRDDGGAFAWRDFETTPPMPAYMLTLDGGKFSHVDGAAGDIPIRVFVRPGQEAHARAILSDAERLLPFYASFFGVPFPMPKLDIVVSPGGLQSAFEGWGAITFYSEAIPFGDQFSGGAAGRRYAVEALAHEMAHQWVGDLVTMRWWRDTFVAEGVAQFAQRRAARARFPELRTWLDDDRDTASLMASGVTADTKPMLQPIATDLDRDDENAFNSATYDKGAAVLDDWRRAVGDAALRSGLRRYLHRYAFKSATFEDFWNALGGVAGLAYGHSWLAKRGFPIVDVRTACNAGVTTVVVTQHPFVSDPGIDAAYRAQRWIVPLMLRVGSRERRIVTSSDRTVVRLRGCGALAAGPRERSYDIERYDDATYARLAVHIGALCERDRELSYRDAVMLHAVGALDDTAYLRLVATAHEPLDSSVWSAIAREYRRMDLLVRDAPEARRLAAMQRKALLPFALRYDRIDSKAAGPFRLGSDSGWALATSGYATDGATFRNDFERLLAGGVAANFESLWLIAMISASDATSDDVQRAEAEMRAHPSTGPAVTFEEAFLENVGDDTLARRVLTDAMADPRLTGDEPTGFLFALGSRHPRLVFDYLRGHAHDIEKRFPPTQQAWSVSMGVAGSLWPAAQPRVLERFLRSLFPADRRTVDTAVAQIDRQWKERRALLRALREGAPDRFTPLPSGRRDAVPRVRARRAA